MSRQFSKKDIWRLQRETLKLNGSMNLAKCKILQLMLTKLYPEKKCLQFPLPVTLPYLSVTNCSYPQTTTGREDDEEEPPLVFWSIRGRWIGPGSG